jgi:hypothetical protein
MIPSTQTGRSGRVAAARVGGASRIRMNGLAVPPMSASSADICTMSSES